MVDPNGHSVFRVYDTAGLQNPQSVLAQTSGEQGNDAFEMVSLPRETAQRTIRYHRESVQADDRLHDSLLLIIDRLGTEEQGVLMVNLQPYHGHVDGLRIEAAQAGDALASLDIANTDWVEEREDFGTEKTNLKPVKWFALYNMLPGSERSSIEPALKSMNDGVGALGIDFDDDDAGGAASNSASNDIAQRDFYSAIETDGRDLDDIIGKHAEYAKNHILDPAMFAVVDDVDFNNKGVLIVKVSSEGTDSFRRKGPTAGEMLNWIFVGLMTWEEAKNWDPSTIVA